MSMVLISCWMYGSELLGAAAVSSGRPFIDIPRGYHRIIEHQLDVITKADHAGEIPRPNSGSSAFFIWCKRGLKLGNLSEPIRGESVAMMKKHLPNVSFSTLLHGIAQVPLLSTGAAKSPIGGEEELKSSLEDSLKEKQERRIGRNQCEIHPPSSPVIQAWITACAEAD